VDKARSIKPSIALTGEYGIPIRDEIELERQIQHVVNRTLLAGKQRRSLNSKFRSGELHERPISQQAPARPAADA
jgi:hypothetical protein